MNHKRKLGFAFSDEVKRVNQKFGHFRKKEPENRDWSDLFLPNFQPENFESPVSPWRVTLVAVVFIISFFGLFLRLFHLQVATGAENRERADFNRIQIRVAHAPRGVIFDRSGVVLAENNPGFRLKGKFISRDQALLLEAKNDLDFYNLEIDAIRSYPFGFLTSHILGYVGQISPEELKDPRFDHYKIGDRVGRAGVEQVYEQVLKGVDGAEVIEIDAAGRKLRTLRRVEPIPGKNLYLSIDAGLQKISFEALKDTVYKVDSCCGALVAENPRDGAILAMVSLPGFDGNVFTSPERADEVDGYFNQLTAPLLNRVVGGTYPPGSTFKITSALAGLSLGKITEKTQIEDTGVINLGPYKFANWYFTQYGKTEGSLDVVKALQRSNDIFFYHVGQKIGGQALGDVAKKFGFGKNLGIDLPGEADGLIPDSSWKERVIKEPWYPGDDLHMAIGQGFLLVTPLQVLAQTAYVAAGGKMIQPHLVNKITNPDGSVVKQFEFQPLVKDITSEDDLEAVKKGLEAVPKPGGTAWPFFDFPIGTAGKTGTAEVGDPKGRTHAWYTAYAPAGDPKIAVTVLVEKGGEGSSVAAPIAKQVFTSFFQLDKNNLKSPIASDSARLGE